MSISVLLLYDCSLILLAYLLESNRIVTLLTGKRSRALGQSFNGSNESTESSDLGQQEEKDLLVCFQDGEKAGEELSFCPKVTSESDEKAYGSDGGLTSSSDDAKISSTNSTSSEDGASSTRKSRKRHLEGEQENGAVKKKTRCDSDGSQVHEKIALCG